MQSFIEYKTSKTTANKGNFGRKKRGGKKEDSDNGKVVVSIGLMVWDVNDEVFKEMRGKRLAVQVNKNANYKTLLDKAAEKWYNFHGNLYEDDKQYTLLLQDGQEAVFLPGTNKGFFFLVRYKEELLNNYKRITFFLCTTEDLDARNDSGMKGKETCRDHNSDNNQDEASLPPKRMPRKGQRREEFGPSRIQTIGMPGSYGISPVGLAGSFAGSLVNDLASSLQ